MKYNKLFRYTPGMHLHYHGSLHTPFPADILVLSVRQNGAVVLILRNDQIETGWPVEQGSAYVWTTGTRTSDTMFHPASECVE